MGGELQGLLDQSIPLAQRLSERLARFQANVEAARQEIEGLYERYTALEVPLTGEDFEKQVLRVVRGLGFIAERTKPTADGGIDIVARRAEPLLRGKYIIQCKNWSKPVGAQIVRELYGVVTDERANKGILITTSRFTQPALEFAIGKPLELIDGDGWRELVLGIPVVAVEAVREEGDDLMAYPELLQLVTRKAKQSIEGLEHALLAISVLDQSFITTVSELDKYLSGFETWVQHSVSTMKELAIARPPADCQELYREIVGHFHDVLVAVLQELLTIDMEDGNIVLRLEDSMTLFGPVVDGIRQLMVFCEEKLDEFRDLMEKEGKGPSIQVEAEKPTEQIEVEEQMEQISPPRARPSKAVPGTVVALLVLVGIAIITILAFVLREGALPSPGPSSYPTPAPSPTFTPHPTSTERPAVILTATPTVSPPSPTPIVHVVQPGDTLSGIAALYGTTAETICAFNELADCTLITPGQELMIPVEGVVLPSPTESPHPTSPTATPTATPIPPTPVPYRIWRQKMTSAMAQAEAWITQIDSQMISNYQEQSSCPLAEQIQDDVAPLSVDLFMAEQPDSWNCKRAEEEVRSALLDIGVSTSFILKYCRYGDSRYLTLASSGLAEAREPLSSARQYYDMCIAE